MIDIEEVAGNLSQSHLACRELGHSWRPYTARWDSEARAYSRVLRCRLCRTERYQDISRSGEVLRNRYQYPDGYLVKGLGRIVGEDKDRLRLESIIRGLDGTP